MKEHRYDNVDKVYVRVTAVFHEDGRLLPVSLVTGDGNRLRIDRILDIRPAASLKAGGMGIRYQCVACGQPFYLFYEEDRWFMERGSLDLCVDDTP